MVNWISIKLYNTLELTYCDHGYCYYLLLWSRLMLLFVIVIRCSFGHSNHIALVNWISIEFVYCDHNWCYHLVIVINNIAHSNHIHLLINWIFNSVQSANCDRDRSFDRITFFRNLSVVLSKFVSKEKKRSFEYRHVSYILLNYVFSKIFRFSKEWYSNKKMLI